MPAARAQPPILLAAAAVCGFGLGALGLAMLDRATPVPAIGLPAVVAPADPGTAAQPALPEPWPALFGSPPAPEPAPPPDTAPDPAPAAPAPEAPRPSARLRGLAVEDDGGWALVEVEGAVALVRPGSPLGPAHAVGTIRAEGVTIEGPGGPWLLEFDTTQPEARTPRPSLPRALLGSGRYFYDGGDLPMPLPPAGYRAGPGLTPGDMR